MRVLIVSPYFPPQNAVASLRVHAYARVWADAGEDVTVLTTAKRDDQRGLDLDTSGFEVIELEYRAPRLLERVRGRHAADRRAAATPTPARRSPLSPLRRLRERRGIFASVRMPDLTDHWVAPATQWCREHGRWDVVLSSSGPYTAHLVAMAARRAGLTDTWVADFRDLWVDNHIFPGLFPFTIRERSLQRQCLGTADVVITVSEGLARRLEPWTKAPVHVVRNGFDPDAHADAPAARIYPDDDKIRVVYTGTTYAAGQDPQPLLAALARLRDDAPDVAERLEVVVVGQGSDGWLDAARRLGVEERVAPSAPVARDDALRMQRDADALVLLDWARPDEGVLTGKLFEYLATNAPIVVVGGDASSPIADVVSRSGRGVHCGGSVDAICNTLTTLVRSPGGLAPEPDEGYLRTLRRDVQARAALDLVRRIR
jgi:glycosyltransferase involved in cell wall biosynthesis